MKLWESCKVNSCCILFSLYFRAVNLTFLACIAHYILSQNSCAHIRPEAKLDVHQLKCTVVGVKASDLTRKISIQLWDYSQKQNICFFISAVASLPVGGFPKHLDQLWRRGWILQKLQNTPVTHLFIPWIKHTASLLFMWNMLCFHQIILGLNFSVAPDRHVCTGTVLRTDGLETCQHAKCCLLRQILLNGNQPLTLVQKPQRLQRWVERDGAGKECQISPIRALPLMHTSVHGDVM